MPGQGKPGSLLSPTVQSKTQRGSKLVDSSGRFMLLSRPVELGSDALEMPNELWDKLAIPATAHVYSHSSYRTVRGPVGPEKKLNLS